MTGGPYCEECGECNRIGAHTPWCSREPDRDPVLIMRLRR